MAPNADIIRYSPTPAFTARMLALPVLSEAVNRALDVFDSSRNRNDAMGAALRAAEASMRVAASGAMPLATPIVNTVGGWSVIDEWACRGLDRVVQAAPIIKKPTEEIVTTTRQTMLRAVAGGSGTLPGSFTEAFTVDYLATTRGGQAIANTADQLLVTAHTYLDDYLPPDRGDRQGRGTPAGGITMKASSLYIKAQQRLYRSAYVLVRPPTDRSLDGTITIALLIDFGRRTATDVYSELLREPEQGETQNIIMSVVRSGAMLTKRFTDQYGDNLQKQLDALRTMDRKALTEAIKNAMQISADLTSNAVVYVRGTTNGVINILGNVRQNARTTWLYLEDLLRKAMADYENRERAARATAAAAAYKKKNQMATSDPPTLATPSFSLAEGATGTKSGKPFASKKM